MLQQGFVPGQWLWGVPSRTERKTLRHHPSELSSGKHVDACRKNACCVGCRDAVGSGEGRFENVPKESSPIQQLGEVLKGR